MLNIIHFISRPDVRYLQASYDTPTRQVRIISRLRGRVLPGLNSTPLPPQRLPNKEFETLLECPTLPATRYNRVLLRDSAKTPNTDRVQTFQPKFYAQYPKRHLLCPLDHTLHIDLKVPFITEIAKTHEKRFNNRSHRITKMFQSSVLFPNRRLKSGGVK